MQMKLTLDTIAALASELHKNLAGSVISAVEALSPVGLRLRAQGPSGKCSLCVPTHPDFFLPFLCTGTHLDGQEKPFVNHLRRHLLGHTITSIGQWRDDRILRVELFKVDEIHGARRHVLILELVPRYQNLILLDQDSGLVVQAFRQITRRMSRFRLIRPGHPYEPPPKLVGSPLRLGSQEQFLRVIRQFPDERLSKTVARIVSFASPYLLGELWPQTNMDPELPVAQLKDSQILNLWKALAKWSEELASWPLRPTLILDEKGSHQALLPYEPKSLTASQKRTFTSLSQALEHIFLNLRREWELESERKSIAFSLHGAVHRNRRTLKRLEADLANAQRLAEFRKLGEIISANIGQLKKGSSEARLTDPYSPRGERILVPLKPKLSPAENAQRYFKRFRKAKAGLPKIQGRLAQLRDQLEKLDSLRQSLQAGPGKDELAEIKAQLVELGFRIAPSPLQAWERGKKTTSRPLTLSLDEGWTILVGRNNRENDLLTHTIARSRDLWFHAQGVPGAHVILRREKRMAEPSKKVLDQAAAAAAYFSRARHSKTVPVVYTERRYVRKPKGAKPGSALVEREKTLFVQPKLPGAEGQDGK